MFFTRCTMSKDAFEFWMTKRRCCTVFVKLINKANSTKELQPGECASLHTFQSLLMLIHLYVVGHLHWNFSSSFKPQRCLCQHCMYLTSKERYGILSPKIHYSYNKSLANGLCLQMHDNILSFLNTVVEHDLQSSY